MTNLPAGDRTPPDYQLPRPAAAEAIKRPLRRLLYPAYNALNHARLASRYATEAFRPDLWLWDQRGNDYDRHRRRVSRILPVEGRRVLVAGCGTGQDLESWVRLEPRRVDGLDWFCYQRAWTLWKQRFARIAPRVDVRLCQGNLACLDGIGAGSVDIVSSDAVFEHLRDLPGVLHEFRRVLRPAGVLYATFGPLWRAWGGDHVSGYDGIASGYNHLLLEGSAYQDYLGGLGACRHSEHDGRTWIDNDLFSRLTPTQYLSCLAEAGFRRRFVSAIIDPRAVAYLKDPQLAGRLLERFERLDLLVSGMTIIYER